MENLIIRNDDFDFRMQPEFYIAVHEHFIVNDLIETAVIQIAKDDRLINFEAKSDVIEYMNTSPNWDLQIHCFNHSSYHEMSYGKIVRDMSAALYHFQELFHRRPTTWFTPHNTDSEGMQKAAKRLGLEINNESIAIQQFVSDAREGVIKGDSVYFHGWNDGEMKYFEEMIELIK